ncbi:MAG: N-acetyltransferase [Moraxellaceae bacterium]|nr:MAG: N-acetyltransferase [Moraxellaceae bacterium]
MNQTLAPYLHIELNEFGQPVGQRLESWQCAIKPPQQTLSGKYVQLIPLNVAQHAEALWALVNQEPDASCWTYLPYGSFASQIVLSDWLNSMLDQDLLLYGIFTGDKIQGWCALMRADCKAGSIEIGHVYYSAGLRRTLAATEAMFLLMQQVFTLGYRRCEWKCNSLNAPSKRAALRLGFQHEGLFRQATIVKGRNRNTDWFSILDHEWAEQEQAMQHWLSSANFDDSGQQKLSLQQCRRSL